MRFADLLCRWGRHKWKNVVLEWRLNHTVCTLEVRRCSRCTLVHENDRETVDMATTLLKIDPVVFPKR